MAALEMSVQVQGVRHVGIDRSTMKQHRSCSATPDVSMAEEDHTDAHTQLELSHGCNR